jgi:diguanylate cyclase (GGDEF)-like protein
LTQSAPKIKHRAVKLINVGHPPLLCVIDQLLTSGVVVNSENGDKLRLLNVGDDVVVQINTHNASVLKVHTKVENRSRNIVQLRYLNPQDTNVKALDKWFHSTPNTRVNPSKSALLKEFNQITSQHISNLLDSYLENTQTGLLKMAERAENNSQQNKLFEALALIEKHGRQIKELSCEALESQLASDLSKIDVESQWPKEEFVSHENLELVDLTQFEDWLSLETIIRRANEQYHHPLTWLEQRYSQLFNRKLTMDELPISVDNICLSVQQALKQLDFDPELMPIVYRFLDESVISQLDELYQVLNNKFKHYGILPNIESQPISSGPLVKTTLNQNQHLGQTGAPLQEEVASSAQLMDAVRQCQNLVNSSSPQTAPPDGQGTQQTLSMDELVNQLSQIQQNAVKMEAMMSNLSLQQALTDQGKGAVAPEAQDLVSLVDSVFRTLESYPHISKALLASFKRLQAPIAKAALLDPSFFSSGAHPARVLLNQMIDLSLNSEVPNAALEQQFENLITEINTNYIKDDSVFERASAILTTVAAQQAKTYSRNTKRIVQTYEGKQLLKLATDTVASEIYQRLRPPKSPLVLVELMDSGWRELLKLTYLKVGPNTGSWRENLEIIDQLVEWLNDVDENNILRIDPQRTSEADSLVDLVEQKLENVFPGDFRYGSVINKIREILTTAQVVEFVAIDPVPHDFTELTQNLKSSKPELNRWFKLAETVNIGDEFSYINDDDGKKNIKLVWVSDDKQHFVFVNNRGQKILDFDLFDLATEFSKGLIPVEKKSELPLVERSLYSTIQQAYESLAFKSTHDELTSLLSRKECDRMLGKAIKDAKNNGCNHYLLYIDIDQFSLINDLHGHIAGDQQLIEIAKLIQESLPEGTVAARMAGNEFVVLLENLDSEQYLTISEDLRASIEQHSFKWNEHQLHLTASIGLVMINEYTKNVIDLIRNAIEACQTAKKNGGNRFYDFRQDSELHTRREKLLSWIDKLDHLLSTDKLVLRAQVITPTAPDDDETHYEILIALKDEQGRLISPVEFIEAAESYGRMQKVDRWVIEKTFQWLQHIGNSPYKVPSISINLSGNSLNDDSFAEFLLDRFEQYGIPTTNICFEVTETATINNIAEVADFIREIKKMGCKFSLDDFGSGNASYQYLRHLPVDYIKIDGMFVQEIDKNPSDLALVKSIHEIARLMGKKTVAEFAESQQIIDVLSDIGVDYMQGYAIGMPLVLQDIKLETRH